jgi:hypothetical protein
LVRPVGPTSGHGLINSRWNLGGTGPASRFGRKGSGSSAFRALLCQRLRKERALHRAWQSNQPASSSSGLIHHDHRVCRWPSADTDPDSRSALRLLHRMALYSCRGCTWYVGTHHDYVLLYLASRHVVGVFSAAPHRKRRSIQLSALCIAESAHPARRTDTYGAADDDGWRMEFFHETLALHPSFPRFALSVVTYACATPDHEK